MTDTTTTTDDAQDLRPGVVLIGGRERELDRPNGYKATRALAILRAITKESRELGSRLAAFRTEYRAEHFHEFNRLQARMQFPGVPLVRDDELVVQDGRVVLIPSPVDRMTEEEWQEAGGVYRVPREPSTQEVVMALFDAAMEVAETSVYRLLALFVAENRDLNEARKNRTLDEFLDERVDRLLEEAYADELVELAAAVGELIDRHVLRKAKAVGPRLGPFLKLLGLEPTTSPTAATPTGSADSTEPTSTGSTSSSRPTSSTGSPASTPDGDPTSSSPLPTTSSSSSPTSSPATTASDGDERP